MGSGETSGAGVFRPRLGSLRLLEIVFGLIMVQTNAFGARVPDRKPLLKVFC